MIILLELHIIHKGFTMKSNNHKTSLLVHEINRNNELRTKIIQKDDILNLRIILGKIISIEDFLKEIEE